MSCGDCAIKDYYVGPYLKCAYLHLSVDTYQVRCLNVNCKGDLYGPVVSFCPQCGTKLAPDLTKPRREIRGWGYCDGKDKNKLVMADDTHDFQYLIPRKGADRFAVALSEFYGTDSTLDTEITAERINKTTADFLVRFKETIELAESYYGENNVTICWGIISTDA